MLQLRSTNESHPLSTNALHPPYITSPQYKRVTSSVQTHDIPSVQTHYTLSTTGLTYLSSFRVLALGLELWVILIALQEEEKGEKGGGTVSYTHLTLPTICSV
eukprot:2410676-Rhodomonas_salina.1